MKLLSLLGIFVASFSLLAATPGPETKKAQQVQKEWQTTFKNQKSVQSMLTEQIDLVIDSQIFLRRTDLDPAFKEKLQAFQEKALKKIIADPKTIMAYLIKDFSQTLIDKNKDLSELDSASARWIRTRSEIRLEAIEAAIKSIGITAIPALTDFQAKVGKYQANLLSNRVQKLVHDIVKKGEKVVEEADRNAKAKEQEQSTARDLFPNLSAEQDAAVKEKEGDGKSTTLDFTTPIQHQKDDKTKVDQFP